MYGVESVPGQWWRVMYFGGIWCETSSQDEARESLSTVPGGDGRLQRLHVRTIYEWRSDDGALRSDDELGD